MARIGADLRNRHVNVEADVLRTLSLAETIISYSKSHLDIRWPEPIARHNEALAAIRATRSLLADQ